MIWFIPQFKNKNKMIARGVASLLFTSTVRDAIIDAYPAPIIFIQLISTSQRISTILHAHQILVLNDGRIVGKGTHEELLRGCETYREIARSQMSAKELGMEEQEVSVNE